MSTSVFRDDALFQTNGQKAHNETMFKVVRTGRNWQRLLTFLESQAEHSQHFNEIAEITEHVMEIRLQLRSQHF